MTSSNETRIIFRDINDIKEMRAVEDLQIRAWGDDARDVVPLNQLAGARHVGGSLIGAFEGEMLAGFVYGFYGHVNGRLVHHSHMLAVHPEYRNQDLAFQLKLAQREHVLRDGLTDRMTWTFDPLQSLNAYFNFAKLGVVSDTYKVNVYGDAGSSFLHRNGTDRLFVTWLLNSRRVSERIFSKPAALGSVEIFPKSTVPLIRCSESGTPERTPGEERLSRSESALLEIPADISLIERSDFSKAAEWRAETRKVFSETLTAGFVVVDFRRKDEGTGVYLLQKGRVEDGSLSV
jgi:predicted GNAT superfamily acetyltransferase